MQTKIIITAIVALIVIVIVVLVTRPANSPTNLNNVSQTSANVNSQLGTSGINANQDSVNFTNSTGERTTFSLLPTGLSPKNPTVELGATIIFLNLDTRVHHIASNPHPNHTYLPRLDFSIEPNSSQSYTFTQSGDWGYHDHDFPFETALQGTITVK